MVRLTVHITEQMLNRLTADSHKQNRSVAYLAREAIGARYQIKKEKRHGDPDEQPGINAAR